MDFGSFDDDAGSKKALLDGTVVAMAFFGVVAPATDCSGADELPSIVWTLGEEKQPIELSPSHYMGVAEAKKFKRWWKFSVPYTESACVPLFETTEEEMTDHGPLYILGLPFFRQRGRRGAQSGAEMAARLAAQPAVAWLARRAGREPRPQVTLPGPGPAGAGASAWPRQST